jgi:poly(hydroxyalkanoate) granule-associated protein
MNEAQATTTGSIGRELLHAGRNLLLAGIGAVAEVDKASLRLFDRLVERGRPLEERQRRAAEALANRASGAMHEAGKLLQDTVEYEARQVLKKVGILTRDDLKVLSARLDVLARQLDEYAAAREVTDRIIITPEEAR